MLAPTFLRQHTKFFYFLTSFLSIYSIVYTLSDLLKTLRMICLAFKNGSCVHHLFMTMSTRRRCSIVTLFVMFLSFECDSCPVNIFPTYCAIIIYAVLFVTVFVVRNSFKSHNSTIDILFASATLPMTTSAALVITIPTWEWRANVTIEEAFLALETVEAFFVKFIISNACWTTFYVVSTSLASGFHIRKYGL